MGLELTAKPLQLMGLPPSPREAHSMLPLDVHRILLLGGGSISPVFGPQQFNDMFLLDLKEAKWSQIPCKGDQPSPRTGQSAVLLEGGQVLIFGGSSMTEGYMNDAYLLDTKEWVWSTPAVKGKPPSPRDKHTACLVGSKLYVFGGFGPSAAAENRTVNEGSDEDEADGADVMSEDSVVEDDCSEEEEDDGSSMSFTWFNDLHVLDLMSMQWQELETKGAKPTPRAAHAAFITSVKDQGSNENKDKMIVFGGRDPSRRQNDLFTLDLQTLEWRKEGSNAPPARSFHVMVPLGGSQLAVSYGGMGVNGEMFPGLELLHLQTVQWTSLKCSGGAWPPLRGATAMVASLSMEESKLIIFGGSCSLEDRETVYYNDAYAIDVSPLLRSA